MKNFVRGLKKGTFGIQVISVTIPTMRKKNNPYLGKVQKFTYSVNVCFGYDYASYLFGKAKKQGLLNGRTLEDFKAEVSKPKGMNWVEFPFFLQSEKDENQEYLRCYYNSNSKSYSIYLIDGKVASEEQEKEINSFISSSSSSYSTKFGVNDITVRSPKLESIKVIVQGQNKWEEPNFKVSYEIMLAMLAKINK